MRLLFFAFGVVVGTLVLASGGAASASAGDCTICKNIDEYAKSSFSSGIQYNGTYRGEANADFERDVAIGQLLRDYVVLKKCNLDNGKDLLTKLGDKIESLTADLPEIDKQSISLMAKHEASAPSDCKRVFDIDTIRFNPPKPPVFEPSPTAANVAPKQIGWVGIRVVPNNVNPAYAAIGGAGVAFVEKKSPAEAAGIMPGDIIIEFDNQKITVPQDLIRDIASTPPGKEVDVVVFRNDQEQHLTLKIGQTADIEALMRNVVPADAVCQRSGIGRDCEYGQLYGFGVKLDVYNSAEVKFDITYPDTNWTTGTGERPHRNFDLNAYAADIVRALGGMQPILEQEQYGFDKAQIDQCLRLPIAETDRPPNVLQLKNEDWTLTCWKGSEGYSAFYRKGNGYTGIHVEIRKTPPPPRNRF